MFILRQLLESPLFLVLTTALFFFSSITTFDKRQTQAKNAGVLPSDHPDLPRWVGAAHIFDWILLIALFVVNWRAALVVWMGLLAFKILPVLETIGNLLMKLFRRTES